VETKMPMVTAKAQHDAMASKPVPFPFVFLSSMFATTPFPRYKTVAVPASSPIKIEDIVLGFHFGFPKL
jgi:hypothetical protein